MADQETAQPAAPAPQQQQSESDVLDAALAAMDGEGGGAPAEPAEAEPQAPQEAPAEQTDPAPPAEPTEPAEGAQEAKPEEQPQDPVDRAWSSIRRKEKELIKERTEFKADREKFETERQQYDKLNEAVRQMQADLRTDPLGFLQRNGGYTMDDLVQFALGDKQPAAELPPAQQQVEPAADSKVMEELRELKALIANKEQQAALETYNNTITDTLSDPKYDLLKSFTAYGPNGDILSAADVVRHRAGLAASQDPQADLTPALYADRLLSEHREHLAKQGSHGAAREALQGNGGAAPPPQAEASRERAPQQPANLTNSLAASPQRPQAAPGVSWEDDEDQILDDALRAMPPE